jgi:hypothetical protein
MKTLKIKSNISKPFRLTRNLRLALYTILISIAQAVTPTEVHAAATIETDGPDFVESSEVVGKGRLQFESDFETERDHQTAIRRSSLKTLVRMGLSDNIEARVEIEGLARVFPATSATPADSLGGTAIGLKWHSHDLDASTGKPSVSWILHLELPRMNGLAQKNYLQSSLRSVITWDLGQDWSAGLMPGMRLNTSATGEHFVSASLGAVLGKKLNERWRVFAESATPQIARAKYGGVTWSWDVGAAYLITDNWQLGMRAGAGLNRNTPNRNLLIELAGRF